MHGHKALLWNSYNDRKIVPKVADFSQTFAVEHGLQRPTKACITEGCRFLDPIMDIIMRRIQYGIELMPNVYILVHVL